MRALLRRIVTQVTTLTLVAVMGPAALLLSWWVIAGEPLPAPLERAEVALICLLGLTGLLGVAGLVFGYQATERVTRRILPPLRRLASHAGHLEEGVPFRPSLPVGVEEIDQLSAAIARGSQLVSDRLAAERDFAADASHQLRTPLTALLMRLEEIAATDDWDIVAEETHIAIAQVERLSGVVDDLLARTRSGSEATPTVALDSVLAALQREWSAPFARQRRAIRITGERSLSVKAAAGALSQILSTLFENALNHGDGTVTVSARQVGPSVVIDVSDEGPGIPPALAQRVFERSVSSTGSGLGLTLARDLAAAQGGRLELLAPERAQFALFLSASTS